MPTALTDPVERARQIDLPGQWASADKLLNRFDARLRSVHALGLLLWTGTLRRILAVLRRTEESRRARAYEQLMLLEHEVECHAGNLDRAGLLVRLGTIKGLLTALMLGLFLSALASDDLAARTLRPRGRGRRRDEILCLIEDAYDSDFTTEVTEDTEAVEDEHFCPIEEA